MRHALTLALTPAFISFLVAAASAQDSIWRLMGSAAESRFGFSVASAGDVNGDGFDDLVVGAFKDDSAGTDAGLVRVLSGADATILFTFLGDHAGDELGRCVAGVGDVDRDGRPDVMAGAALEDTNGPEAGAARVYSGRTGSVLFTLYGDSALDRFGVSVAGVGDLDGDGHADVVVGAYRDDNIAQDAGSARVVSGRTGLPLFVLDGDSASDFFGWSVAAAGDVDGDGTADIVVGAYGDDFAANDAGSAYVHSGRDGSRLLAVHGASIGAFFGYCVAGAGDVDHDGHADLLVGAYGDDLAGADAGAAFVCSGADGAILRSFRGDSAGDWFGFSVAGLGDVDGDGFGDLAIGAHQDDPNGADSGSASVYSGRTGDLLASLFGDTIGDNFGQCVAGAGDVDGDGLADLVVGAPLDETSLLNAGAALVFGIRSGAPGSIRRAFGQTPYEQFGRSVADAGDVDGDGIDDLVLGALFASRNGYHSGSLRVISGADGATLHTFFGDNANDELGRSVAGAGDVDGDGFADLIAGAARAAGDTGYARVYSGRSGAVLHTFAGPAPFHRLGVSVAGAGDVDVDGFDDVIVGAFSSSIGGGYNQSAHVYSGRSGAELHVFVTTTELGFGWSVAGAGDTDGDGYPDLVVGAYRDGSAGNSSATVYSGRTGLILRRYRALVIGDQFGFSVAGAGDVDGDGFDDIIVGADAGNYARVFSGASGDVLHTFRGDVPGARFGASVASAGDVDGDGHADLVVGAPNDDVRGLDAGSARVLSGRSGVALHTFHGEAVDDEFGTSVARAGDLDGDGFDELVVGAPYSDATFTDAGAVYGLELGFVGSPAQARRIGAACTGSNLAKPHVDWIGRPFVGQTIRIVLRGAVPARSVVLNLGTPTNVDLTPIGMTGCALLANPDVFGLPYFTDGVGMARPVGIAVPNSAALVGLSLAGQWICLDPGANALGITSSDGVRIVLGI